jgi:TonB family protein
VLDQGQIFVPSDPIARRPGVLLSVFAHLVVLVSIVAFRPTITIRLLPAEYTVQKISGTAALTFKSAKSKSVRPSLSRVRRSARQARLPETRTAETGTGVEILREHARQATAAMMTNFKMRHIYGFSTIDYQLPFQTSGEIPIISAEHVPSRFEQYVVVEVTIDIDGRVAYARIVAGQVDQAIQQTLLSAVREFKYRPATRDGTPIPSQVDIVIHIPT